MKILLVSLICCSTVVRALWPIPHQISTGTSPLQLSLSFQIELAPEFNAPEDLKDAVSRTHHQLLHDKLGRLVVGRGPGNVTWNNVPSIERLVLSLGSNHSQSLDLVLDYAERPLETLQSISEETRLPIEGRDEGYSLNIPENGSDATLVANTALGLFRGLTTFSQLWYHYKERTYAVDAPIRIVDKPYYNWRGLMLDTARNFYPINDIKRTLDAMSWVKLNVFHWHVVDSQSFPLVLPGFEELAAHGAYSVEQTYSTEDLDEIVSYAAARGIDVMLEIDTPGHTAAIYNSHPEFVACFEAAPWVKYANEPPAGQLRLTESPVIDFTRRLFEEAIKHTPGQYFSTGGDEINMHCYKEDSIIQNSLNSRNISLLEALADFTNQTHASLLENGKTPVVWQEMVLDHGKMGLHSDTIVLVWVSSAHTKSVARAGHKIVHAPSDYFYLDCGQGAWIGNPSYGNSWCDPFKTWHKAYSFDPKKGLSDEEAKLVLGGQQLLWSEQSDSSNLDPTLWPRAAASAEVFWTGPIHPNGHPLDPAEALPRLHDLRYRMVQRGVRAIALQPEYCALRAHACDQHVSGFRFLIEAIRSNVQMLIPPFLK